MCIASSQVTWKHLSGIHDPNKQHILGALAETQQDLNKQHAVFFQQQSYIRYEEVIHVLTKRHQILLKKPFKKFTHMSKHLGKKIR
jgi:hypothetical protein